MTLDEANKLTLALCQQFQDAGLPGDDAFAVLFAHALAIGNDTRGPAAMAEHLATMALTYGAESREEAEAMLERNMTRTSH